MGVGAGREREKVGGGGGEAGWVEGGREEGGAAVTSPQTVWLWGRQPAPDWPIRSNPISRRN